MSGATRHVAGKHGATGAVRAAWWLLGQPGVGAGLVAGGLAGVVHVPPDLCLGTATVVGGGIASATVYRCHVGMAARLRRAMVDVGLVQRKDFRTTIEPRLRGRVRREGRNLVMRWELPAGVTLRKVRDHLEEIEQRCDVGLSCRLERGRLHMEVGCHPLAARVDFEDFYAGARPHGELPVGLGRSRRGSLWVDLALLPHLLVGGTSGGGKSAFVRQVLTWLTLRWQPSQVRLLLLDFKGGMALARFGRLPHALRPVVADALEAPAALMEVKAEMDRRQAAMREADVEDIDGWHEAGKPRLPRIVVVVDELAQLTMGALGGKENDEARAAQKKAVGLLCELGRLGRATGVHLILGTQRPDADAIPGQLKAVCGGTVAFRVRNVSNSMILLDCDRAALLPPHPGRAVWSHDGLEEFQGIFLENDDGWRLLEERWLREAEHVGDPGGVSRWRPAPAPGLATRCVVSMSGVHSEVTGGLRRGVERVSATAGEVRASLPRPRRSRGAGVPPAADPGDGAAELQPVEPDHVTPAAAAPAVSPLPIPADVRPVLRVEAWNPEDPVTEEAISAVSAGDELPGDHHDVDLVDDLAGELEPFPVGGPDHVTQGHQNTWQACDVEGAWA